MTAAKRAAEFDDHMTTQGNDENLNDASGRYCNTQKCNIETVTDVPLFWHQIDRTTAASHNVGFRAYDFVVCMSLAKLKELQWTP